MKYIIFSIVVSLSLFSCKNSANKNESTDFSKLVNESAEDSVLAISEESMSNIIQSLPSPLEISSKIKETGVKFDEQLLNKTNNSDLYSVDVQKAFALGIYAGDLGYINMYGKSYLAVDYLTVIKKIADDLQIGQFFDFETLKRLGANSENLDSLLYLSTVSFEKMDRYLREQKRGKLSVLTVCGTWLESMHLATSVVSSQPDKGLIERIGEQKMILDQLLLVLSIYNNDEYISELIASLGELKTEYDKVTVSYIYREPETKEVNGRLVIVDNSKTEVRLDNEQLEQITMLIRKIRLKLILNS